MSLLQSETRNSQLATRNPGPETSNSKLILHIDADAFFQKLWDEAEAQMRALVETHQHRAVPLRHVLARGAAGSLILDYAEAEAVDVIVMGTHGRSGLSRLLMGSVAEAVVRRAKCPVLTYKQPAEQTTTA